MLYLVIFQSITYAQRAANVLSGAGITSWLIRAPAALNGGSCGYALKIRTSSPQKIADILRKSAISYKQIFNSDTGSQYFPS